MPIINIVGRTARHVLYTIDGKAAAPGALSEEDLSDILDCVDAANLLFARERLSCVAVTSDATGKRYIIEKAAKPLRQGRDEFATVGFGAW